MKARLKMIGRNVGQFTTSYLTRQAPLTRPYNGFSAGMNAQLLVNARHVVAHRLFGNTQILRDDLIAVTLRDVLQDLALSRLVSSVTLIGSGSPDWSWANFSTTERLNQAVSCITVLMACAKSRSLCLRLVMS